MNCLGLDWRKGLQSLPKFEQVAHRLQDIGVIGGVRFINDSISTAPEAAISAMKSFDDNLIIISGGTVNQQNYADYARFIENNPKVKAAITLFQCGPQIAGDIKNYVKRDGFRLIEAETLAQAVTEAYRIAHEDGATLVLFSPTAPSFGFYKNFMARGEDFINCVKTLAK
jgi:UDP-N-acetylmuramoylalanine--D-glutamate ligase